MRWFRSDFQASAVPGGGFRFSACVTAALLASCHTPPDAGQTPPRLTGEAFGTTWSVVINAPEMSAEELGAVREMIEVELTRFDDAVSTWNPKSDLSRFNAAAAGEPVPVSPLTAGLITRAATLSRTTGGAFDPTVGPLVRRWKFGPDRETAASDEPSEEELTALLARGGADNVEVGGSESAPTLTKLVGGLEVDLSAFAKGAAVDAVSEVLANGRGLTDTLVEIGGEVRARGERAGGGPWRVMIERPDVGRRAALRVVALGGAALATSGDYRNFRMTERGTVSHVIDPRTGRPAESGVASASVIAPDCETADGVATALMVLRADEGYDWAVANDVAAMIVSRGDGGEPVVRTTPAFETNIVSSNGGP